MAPINAVVAAVATKLRRDAVRPWVDAADAEDAADWPERDARNERDEWEERGMDMVSPDLVDR
jgi:hypothetical protein